MEIFQQIYACLTLEEVPNSKKRFAEIHQSIKEDKQMEQLIEVISKGWPDTRKKLPEEVKPYFDYREELVEED